MSRTAAVVIGSQHLDTISKCVTNELGVQGALKIPRATRDMRCTACQGRIYPHKAHSMERLHTLSTLSNTTAAPCRATTFQAFLKLTRGPHVTIFQPIDWGATQFATQSKLAARGNHLSAWSNWR